MKMMKEPMSQRESLLLAGCLFFAGMVLGFLLAPFRGTHGGFGSNCGNTTNYYYHAPDTEVEENEEEATEISENP